ncbi:MAG TPA: TetR/AcrR family transcriptional regulator [bacterium]|nr:TetR/AcrR family transcriptional regulator [bacterium]
MFKISNSRSNQRAETRRGEILASASGAFRRLGVRRAGMREIAQAAGLSPGNLYYYFRNKDELVYFCQDRSLDALLAVAAEAKKKPGAPAQLEHLVRGHLSVLLDRHAAGTLHLDLDLLPAPLLRKVIAKRDRYEERVRAILAEGQRRGEVRAGDAKLAAFGLLGALNWSARWFRPDAGWTVEGIADSFVDQLLRGLLVAPRKRRNNTHGL